MLLSSIRETSVLFQSLHDLFIYLLLVEVFLSTTAGHLEKNINCVKEKWSHMSSTEKAIISKSNISSVLEAYSVSSYWGLGVSETNVCGSYEIKETL